VPLRIVYQPQTVAIVPARRWAGWAECCATITDRRISPLHRSDVPRLMAFDALGPDRPCSLRQTARADGSAAS
jgi:hypothetical protein